MVKKENTPRLLIISNSCLSNSTSNGRTLRNFLIGWNAENIAQFYIQNEVPDFSVCHNYYRVTDGQALKSLLRGTGAGGKMEKTAFAEVTEPNNIAQKKHKRTSLTMFLRELVWNSKRWMGRDFDKWIDEYSPEVVLLQSGDSPFMLKLALDISRKRNIPLVIYNSEVYYFKDFDYFRAKGISHMLYPLFHRYYKKVFDKTIKYASKSIYICEMVQQLYDKEFNLPSTTIYTATQAKYVEQKLNENEFVVSYLGNLGVGRHQGLIDIGNALQKISPKYKLDIYGKIPNDAVRADFESCQGINYKGFISYEQVLEVMRGSNLLVHVENFSEFYRKDLQYAFSTKIADSLAMGVGFLVYAPEEMAFSKYLKENEAAFVVSDKNELIKTINYLIENTQECRKYSETACDLARENHSFKKNATDFQNVLRDTILGGKI